MFATGINFIYAGTRADEPPLLDLAALNGTEDNPVTLNISAQTFYGGTNASTELTIRIINFPIGSTFNKGTFNRQIWILNSTDFGEVELYLPQHSSGRFNITAEALYARSNYTRMGTVYFSVQAVADTPTLNVIHDFCIQSRNFSFSINSTLVDSDGSEMLLITVSGLPSGTHLSAGRVDTKGDYTLEPAALNRSIVATIPHTPLDAITVGFTAITTEKSSNSMASAHTTISLSRCKEGKSYSTYDVI